MSFAPRGVEIKAKGPDLADQRPETFRGVKGLELGNVADLQREHRMQQSNDPFAALEQGTGRSAFTLPSLSTPFVKR